MGEDNRIGKKSGSNGNSIVFGGLIFLEVAFFLFLVVYIFLPSMEIVVAGASANNVTVRTSLSVGNTHPEILSVIVETNAGSKRDIDLLANSTKMVNVFILARDYNGKGDIRNFSMRFFDNTIPFSNPNDNNNYYRNDSCLFDYGYGDQYEVSANCTVYLFYYANNATWNATILVSDNSSYLGRGSNTSTINTLLALELPDNLDYGTVNATAVSDEVTANVSNAGNVRINLTLSGYAHSAQDNLSMNCTLGSIKNISIGHEKYNLSAPNPGPLDIASFSTGLYTNLSRVPKIRKLDLNFRQDDGYNEAVNASYWRIYVPMGVAGSCSGNIVFGAVVAQNSSGEVS